MDITKRILLQLTAGHTSGETAARAITHALTPHLGLGTNGQLTTQLPDLDPEVGGIVVNILGALPLPPKDKTGRLVEPNFSRKDIQNIIDALGHISDAYDCIIKIYRMREANNKELGQDQYTGEYPQVK